MLKDFGVTPRDCLVAVGPGIAAENYEVDSDVADKFREAISAGSAVAVMPKHEFIGKWDLNLRSVIFSQLLSAGFKPESIETADLDTFSNKSTFFSHRRESLNNQSTGRMAAVLGMRA
jgi:copper oxidase (laccase) domain-containing protein